MDNNSERIQFEAPAAPLFKGPLQEVMPTAISFYKESPLCREIFGYGLIITKEPTLKR